MNQIRTISSFIVLLLVTSAGYAGSSFWGGFTGSLAGSAVSGIGQAIAHDAHCHRPCHYHTRTVVYEQPVEKVIVQEPVVVERQMRTTDSSYVKKLELQNQQLKLDCAKLEQKLEDLEVIVEKLEYKIKRASK